MKRIIIAMAIVWATSAAAQMLHGVTEVPRKVGAGGGGVVPACGGTINLSTGCVQPMLGGL